MGSICLLSDGGLPSVSCVTHYSFVRSFRKLSVACTTSLWLQGAPPPQPGGRTHTHEDAEAEGTARAARAGSLLSRTPPLPDPACTPHKVRRAVWRTHTVGCPALAAGARRLPRPQRHTCGTRFFFASRHPRHAHTRSLAADAWPTLHPCVSLHVPALHSPSDTAVPTRP